MHMHGTAKQNKKVYRQQKNNKFVSIHKKLKVGNTISI